MARTLKMEPKNVRINVTSKFFREGSVIAGTAKSHCDSIVTELQLDSDEPPDRVAQLIRMAEASCFTMAALRNIVHVELAATVNGQAFQVTA